MMKLHARLGNWLLTGAVLAAGSMTGEADAANQCLSSQAAETLAQCPGGKLQATIGKRQAVSFKTVAPPDIKRDTKPPAPTTSMTAAQRDERRAGLAARSRQLLVTEIQGLEQLFASTPTKAADRPKLLRRLAEGYVELESAAFRDKVESEVKADEAKKKKDAASQAKFIAEAGKADKVLKASRSAAIKHYTSLKNQYPKWCLSTNKADPSKSTGCGDEVLYYLAYEWEQAGDLEKARKVYYELIDKHKKSKYIPNAYLAFGELFFNEAQTGDAAKWDLAAQSYREVIKYPAPDNKVWGYAHYKLGYVQWNKENYAEALQEFKKTIEFGVQFAQLPNAKPLAEAARRDILPLYALIGDPLRAHDFLKPLSGDKTGENARTLQMMDDLGTHYLDTGHYKEAIELYRDLMSRDKGEKYCKYQTHVTEATGASKSGNKDPIRAEIERQLDVFKKYQTGASSAEGKLACANATAGVLAETAMAWHLEAVGSGGVRGTGDVKTMRHAADLYQMTVNQFTQADFEKFKFPKIVKEDWPSIFKIRYAMADLLYFQKDWQRCGPAFDAVVAEDPNGPQAPEAAYAAVLCYQNIYAETHRGNADRKGSGNLPGGKEAKDAKDDSAQFKAKDFTESQKGMITAFNRYVCYIKPPAGDKAAMANYVEVKFARARTYFEAQRWEEAALAFREIALDHADHDAGIYASQLYLESVNILGSKMGKPECYDDMKADVPKFLGLYCEGAKATENEEQCGILGRIQRDIERLAAENLVKTADKGGAEATRQYTDAGDRYLGMWKKYGEVACETGKKEACERSEEVLYNAAKAYQSARLVAKAIAVRKILIDPKYNLHNTAPAKKAIYEIGAAYQAIAVYDEAARWYERYAGENPKGEKAAEALQDTIVLRLGLGEEAAAIKSADLFFRNYGQSKPALSAQIAFAIGAHYVDRGDWESARKRLAGSIGLIDKNATFDVQVQAHALLGRIYSNGKNGAKQAAAEFNKVRGYWKDPEAGIKKIDAIGGDEGERLRRLAKVLTAVGESLFFFAEEKRALADLIKFPAYKGNGAREDVIKHISNNVAPWMQKKSSAITEAEKAYLAILDLKPTPPPQWVIAAGSRAGQLWGKFAAEFRAAPIPNEWKKNGPSPIPGLSYEEIRGEYYAGIDEKSEPWKQRAKGGFKKCLDLSVQYQHFDDYSRACEVWLSKNYSAEYHLVDEFRAAPNRIGTGLNDQLSPVSLDGTVYRADTPTGPGASLTLPSNEVLAQTSTTHESALAVRSPR